MTVYRDIDLRHEGYDPVPSPRQYQRPDHAFARSEVRAGEAVVFRTGRDIWSVYRRPEVVR